MSTGEKDVGVCLRELVRWHRACGWVQAVHLTDGNLGMLAPNERYDSFLRRCPWILEWKGSAQHVKGQPETGWNLFRVDLDGMLKALADKYGFDPVSLLLELEET